MKFLIMNTRMDIIDQLVKKVRVLEEKVNSMQKELKKADTKAQTASNNVSSALKSH
jgi:hypothetical protein